jgi:hypothetical protein
MSLTLTPSAEQREKSSRPSRVGPVLVAKSLNQLGLFYACADNEHRQGRTAEEGEKPIRGQQAERETPKEAHDVERMTHPAVGAVGDQRVRTPGDNRVGEILAQAVERPEQEEGHYKKADRPTGPAEPGGQCERRPRHPGRVYQVRGEQEPGQGAAQPEADHSNEAFLRAVQSFPRRLGLDSVIEPDRHAEGDVSQGNRAKRRFSSHDNNSRPGFATKELALTALRKPPIAFSHFPVPAWHETMAPLGSHENRLV